MDKRKIQQRIEKKIQQKKRQKQNKTNGGASNLQQSYSSSLSAKTRDNIKQWMKGLQLQLQDQNVYAPSNDKFVELEMLGNQDQKQLEQVKVKIHEQQKQMDHYKYKMLEITKQLQRINFQKHEKAQKYQKDQQQLNKTYKQEMQALKIHFQGKIDKYLQQIDTLLQQKAQFNQQCQLFIQQDNKMNKVIKDMQERYKKDIKNAREAFIVLQKEKRQKWQQSRIAAMKQQATVRLQPKLQSIIKDGNDEIKKANVQWQQKHIDFTKQYTAQINKKLQSMKQVSFTQAEKQKQNLRAEERKKLKQSYQKLQFQFEQDRAKIRRMYKEQILQLQKKRREQVEEFLNSNKVSQEEHLTNIKKMREDYQNKIRSMKENVRQRVSEQITKIEKIYKKKLEQAQAMILQQNQQKFMKAKQKIDQSIGLREKQAKQKIKKQGTNLQRDIEAKYQKKLMKMKKQVQDQKQKLRFRLKQIESRLIAQESAQKNETSKNTMFYKQSVKNKQKNEGLLMKIKQKQDQINRIRENIQIKNLKFEEQLKKVQQEGRKQYQLIDKLIGKKRQQKFKIQEQWLQNYAKQDDQNMLILKKLQQQKQKQIKKQTQTCKQLARDLEQITSQNKKLTQQLQLHRKKMKMMK